jgi:hypothetical protein
MSVRNYKKSGRELKAKGRGEKAEFPGEDPRILHVVDSK